MRRIANGGHHRPASCAGRGGGGGAANAAATYPSAAIIVPYRDRELNLRTFVTYLHSFLLRQGDIEYKIYLITQVC